MQEESKVIYKLYEKNLTHFLIKKSGINILWKYFNSKKYIIIIARLIAF